MIRPAVVGVVLAAIGLAACGSSNPKPVTVTVPTGGPSSTPTSSRPEALVSESAPVSGGPYRSAPTKLDFSADGDLTAESLRWSGWGEPVTVATGTFIFRDYPSDAREAISGTVTLSLPVECGGKSYYSAGVVHAPGGPFEPGPGPTKFSTPCPAR